MFTCLRRLCRVDSDPVSRGANPDDCAMSFVRSPEWTRWSGSAFTVLPWPASWAGPGCAWHSMHLLCSSMLQSGKEELCDAGMDIGTHVGTPASSIPRRIND